ncbi:MAG: lysine--tRNA ligase [Capsulimonadales bacterium]|nr:lysine--tRNA ligase [Capsulimonadales bacterium]
MNEPTLSTETPSISHSGIVPERLAKLNALREAGHDPFGPETFERTHSVTAIRDQFETLDGATVRIAGRVVSARGNFLDLLDESGRGQVYLSEEDLADYALIKDHLDLGDFLGIEGYAFETKKGDKALHARSVTFLAKALRDVGGALGKEYRDKTSGEMRVKDRLSDPELRQRMRYVDLFVNREARDILVRRIKLTRAVREFLDAEGFLEVETPVLQAEAGGASARPFDTHHNALDIPLHLRISLELYLKRLIVGGLEKVYEIGRVFRNEGTSTRHNPEFTLLELYQAYTNLEGMMDIVERMFRHICRTLTGGDTLTTAERAGFLTPPHVLDFSRPWARLSMLDGIRQYAGIEPDAFLTLETARDAVAVANRRLRVDARIDPARENSIGGIIEKLHEVFTQPNLIQPTFITDFPLETSPLARKRPDNPRLTRRFEAYILGYECGNAFSEINDPLDQRERFEYQVTQKAAGDPEAHPMDEDFLRALEYGMPPTGGFGMGMDRVAMVFTGAETIREVIFFPLLRPERHGGAESRDEETE